MSKQISKVVVVAGLTFLLLGAGVVLGSSTQEDPVVAGGWYDNFDGYETDSALHGQGGWLGWDYNSAATGYVRDEQAISIPNSLEIQWNNGVTADMVQCFTGYDSGILLFSVYQFVPADMIGEQYFILLNTFEHGAPHNDHDFSLQLVFSAADGLVWDYNDPEAVLPLITDQWVKIEVEIDFDVDLQTAYYGNVLLQQCSWKDHVSPGGQANLAAIDLYAGDAKSTSVYYDNVGEGWHCPFIDAGGPYEGYVGIPIQFTGYVGGVTEPYSCVWEFGDGATAYEQNSTHAYACVGNYTAAFTVTDAEGCSMTDTASVTVRGPVINISKITCGIGVTATVKNTGPVTATNIPWTISCYGLLLKGKTLPGTIDSLAVGAETTVKSMVFGFGRITITVAAGNAVKTSSGFVLLVFVFGVK